MAADSSPSPGPHDEDARPVDGGPQSGKDGRQTGDSRQTGGWLPREDGRPMPAGDLDGNAGRPPEDTSEKDELPHPDGIGIGLAPDPLLPGVIDAGFLPRGGPRDPRRGGFASGGVLETCLPGPALAGFAEDAAGPGRDYPGLTDDELIGSILAWGKLESWAGAGKLSAMAELSRRRAASGREAATRRGIPAPWSKYCADEIAAALALSRWAAGKQLDLADDLATRLPMTRRALEEGRIDLDKAYVIAGATAVLDESGAAAAEALVIPQLDGKNSGQVRSAIGRAVLKVDPDAARKRREEAQKDARVELWREDAGTAALCGFHLPPDQVLAADQAITSLAMDLKNAGCPGTMDQLRARAYLDILLGKDTRRTVARSEEQRGAEPADAGACAGAGSGTGPGGPTAAGPRDSDTDREDCRTAEDRHAGENLAQQGGQAGENGQRCDDDQANDGRRSGEDDRPGKAGPAGRPPGPAEPAGPGQADSAGAVGATGAAGAAGAAGDASAFGAAGALGAAGGVKINLTIPLTTLLGLTDHPGEAAGFGPIDADLARTMAADAAGNPAAGWCITVTDQHGHPTAHGCAAPPGRGKPRRKKRPGNRPPGTRAPRGRDTPAADTYPAPVPAPAPATGPQGSGPPGGYGTWRWRWQLPGSSLDLTADLEPIAVTDCDHRHQTTAHDPSGRLRHLVEIRDGECTYPPCRRAAERCDFEHAIPWEEGGRTCGCNAGPCCRHHHHLKQAAGWKLEQNQPGYHTWITPAGRRYTTGPISYPVLASV